MFAPVRDRTGNPTLRKQENFFVSSRAKICQHSNILIETKNKNQRKLYFDIFVPSRRYLHYYIGIRYTFVCLTYIYKTFIPMYQDLRLLYHTLLLCLLQKQQRTDVRFTCKKQVSIIITNKKTSSPPFGFCYQLGKSNLRAYVTKGRYCLSTIHNCLVDNSYYSQHKKQSLVSATPRVLNFLSGKLTSDKVSGPNRYVPTSPTYLTTLT